MEINIFPSALYRRGVSKWHINFNFSDLGMLDMGESQSQRFPLAFCGWERAVVVSHRGRRKYFFIAIDHGYELAQLTAWLFRKIIIKSFMLIIKIRCQFNGNYLVAWEIQIVLTGSTSSSFWCDRERSRVKVSKAKQLRKPNSRLSHAQFGKLKVTTSKLNWLCRVPTARHEEIEKLFQLRRTTDP